MGLVFGYAWQRTGRLWPLIIAHTVIDAVAFVGYSLLAGRLGLAAVAAPQPVHSCCDRQAAAFSGARAAPSPGREPGRREPSHVLRRDPNYRRTVATEPRDPTAHATATAIIATASAATPVTPTSAPATPAARLHPRTTPAAQARAAAVRRARPRCADAPAT